VDMICEKPEMLGMSNHLLYLGRKTKRAGEEERLYEK